MATTTLPDRANRLVGKTKQGAYGKVRKHSESLIAQLSHPDEVWALLLYRAGLAGIQPAMPLESPTPATEFCERMLQKTSRSFAMVIQQLPPRLRATTGVFYLVLRGLDTVEDDMVAFSDRADEKLRLLRSFHESLRDRQFSLVSAYGTCTPHPSPREHLPHPGVS